MTNELFIALITFCFATSITPGPNNLMLMASGANFGFRRSIPHMLGVGVGFSVMVFLVGVGLANIFQAVPASYVALKIASVIYLLWLAWKIATAAPPAENPEAAGRPFTFLQAAAFQWVNPKAWAMALTAITVYAPSSSIPAVLLVMAAFGMAAVVSTSSWAALGQQLRRILTAPHRLRAFNMLMAALLIGSLFLVFI